MKKQFPGFYPLSPQELDEFYKNSVVVFGVTMLLDLYRINGWKTFMDVIEKQIPRERRWLPYDTAWYYHKALPYVILEEMEKTKTASMYLHKFKEMINNPCHHPYLDSKLMSRFDKYISLISKDIINTEDILNNNLSYGELKQRIHRFYEGRIGEPYDNAQMLQLQQEAKEKHKNQENPCLSISNSQDERINSNRYIVWKQIQKYAKEVQRPISLVLNRITYNWFAIYNDVIMPQPSLVNEFKLETGVDIHITTAYDFINRLDVDSPRKEEILKQLHNKPTLGNDQQIQFISSDQQII